MNEGQGVVFDGPESEGIVRGDQGTLLARDGAHAAHVLWATGSRAGDTTLVWEADLAAVGRRTASLIEDSLEFGGLTSFAVREVYDTEGETGVLNAMAQIGHLQTFASIAEEALAMITARIRQDPSFREVCAQLDEEEGESLVRLASACLIRDAFGEPEA
jgi:hypothetical protein